MPGPPPALKLPPIQKHKLSNGLPVWIVEMHEIPVVDVSLIVKAGGADDPLGKYGLASFTSAMLDEGAGKHDALALADAVEFLGASLSTGASFDSSNVRLHVPVARLDDALPLLADVALRPTFPTTELERLRKERLTTLLQTRDNPSSLASSGFAQARVRTAAPLRHADARHRTHRSARCRRRTCAASTRRTTSRATRTCWSSATSRRRRSCQSSKRRSADGKTRRRQRRRRCRRQPSMGRGRSI